MRCSRWRRTRRCAGVLLEAGLATTLPLVGVIVRPSPDPWLQFDDRWGNRLRTD